MAVQPQTPYKEYTANGITKSFALDFYCDNQDHLIVLVDDIEPVVGTWSLNGGAVVFNTAPTSGKKITVQRNTPASRSTEYKSSDNSFRPGPINKDFDRIWLRLQELGVADWILSNRIDALKKYTDQQDTKLQKNIDNLKTYVDDRDDELRAYLLAEIRKQGVALDQLEDYYNYLMQQLAQVAINKGWNASFIVSADGSTQQEINDFGGAKWWNKPLGYNVGATVKIANGDIVKSTVANNTANPNIDMTGWINPEEEQQKLNGKLKDQSLNLDDFKTGANTDADAFYAMLSYAKSKGIKNLNITRDITLNRKITVTQDSTGWLNNLTINDNGHKINWTGSGADNLAIGIIEVCGLSTTTTSTVTVDYAEYTSELTVANASNFKVGDWILINSVSIAKPDIYLNHIVKIESISGNVLQTDTVRRLAVRPSIAAVNVTKVNVIDGFKFIGNPLFTAENQTVRSNGIGAVQMQYCVASHAILRSEKLWFKTVRISQCSRMTVIANSSKPAATGGGEGYSIQAEYTTHSVLKSISDRMRHAVDLSCSWHNSIIWSYDFESQSASYTCHAAFEYNNHFFNCKSVRSAQYGFQFGIVTGTFADTTDENYLHDCIVEDSIESSVNFANKGKGLNIYGGSYRSRSYSITTSNNDTFIYNAKLPSGVQVTSSADMNTDGKCELHACITARNTSSRSINLLADRKINLFGGSVSGVMSLGANSTIITSNTEVICPSNTNLIGSVPTATLKMRGGKFVLPTGATADQTNTLKLIDFDGVEFAQTDSSRINNLLGVKTVLKNCTGAGRFSFNGASVNDLTIQGGSLEAVASAALLNLINYTGKLRLVSATLLASGNAIVTDAGTVISRLQMVGNDITGVTSIADTKTTSAIVSNNMFAGTTILPTHNGTSKFVENNILTA